MGFRPRPGSRLITVGRAPLERRWSHLPVRWREELNTNQRPVCPGRRRGRDPMAQAAGRSRLRSRQKCATNKTERRSHGPIPLYYTREFCGSAHTHEAITAILRWEAGLCQPEPKSESAIRLIWSDGVDSSWGSRPCLAAAGDAGSFTGCPIRRLR